MCRRVNAGLGEDHLVKCGVQLAVAKSREAVAANPTGGDLDRRAARVTGKGRIAGEALGAADLDHQASGDQVADPGDGEQAGRHRPGQDRDLGS